MPPPGLALCYRCLHGTGARASSSLSKLPWRKEAEQIVGYPTSFLNLRYLLSDEISNVVGHLRKLVGTRHPLLKTARKLLDDEAGFQSRGITILLMSKALATSSQETSPASLAPNPSGISPGQRHLSEIIELIYTAELIHDDIVDVERTSGEQPDTPPDLTDEQRSELSSGNKLTVLLGDYLLANASAGLGKLYNTEVAENISQALSDMKVAACLRQSWQAAPSEARYALSDPLFASRTDHITQSPYESRAEGREAPLSLRNWMRWVRLAHGSLLAHGCHGTALLAGTSADMQEQAKLYGWHLAMADELHSELEPVSSDSSSQLAPGLLRSLCLDNKEFQQARDSIPQIRKYHALAAAESLGRFPPSDALHALKRMAVELGS